MRNSAARISHPAAKLRLLCPAKINLHLRVGPRRDDGFHPLLSWMATIGLFDTLSLSAPPPLERPFQPAQPVTPPTNERTENWSDGVVMTCDDPSLPCDGRNLVVKAAAQFRQLVSTHLHGKSVDAMLNRPLSIHLEKQIPAGGGLGGGSSDAARALLGLNRLWVQNEVGEAECAAESDDDSSPSRQGQEGMRVLSERPLHEASPGEESPGQTSLGEASLHDAAARLGSDVPFFLYGPSSVCEGRGESVRPIGAPEQAKWVMLVLPPVAMPTADVYRRFDQLGLGRAEHVEREPGWNQWVTLGCRSLLPMLVNDLEAPAFSLRPDLGELREAIERTVQRTVRMSGSGSSLFTLFDEAAEATSAAARVTSEHGVRAIAIELCPRIEDDLP